MLFLKQAQLNQDGTCTDVDVREGQPNGRCIGASTRTSRRAGSGFWSLNDRAPLKPGEMQIGRPEWMKSPAYRDVAE
jgi:hypothetical protein